MFDIGFGEILLIILLVFLFCPKDIPKILRKIGQFLAGLDKIKDEIFDIKKDLTDTIKYNKNNVLDDFKVEKIKQARTSKIKLKKLDKIRKK
jgi:Sec-independent protein translocase protein TatA